MLYILRVKCVRRVTCLEVADLVQIVMTVTRAEQRAGQRARLHNQAGYQVNVKCSSHITTLRQFLVYCSQHNYSWLNSLYL